MSAASVVEFPQQRTRIANYTGAERCRHCQDDAMLLISVRREPVFQYLRRGVLVNCAARSDARVQVGEVETEEFGPCPFCERGFRLEFGLGARTGPDGTRIEYENPKGGPWGRDGYWRGKPTPEPRRSA